MEISDSVSQACVHSSPPKVECARPDRPEKTFNRFLTEISGAAQRVERCPRCVSIMQHVHVTVFLFGSDRQWNICVPVFSRCNEAASKLAQVGAPFGTCTCCNFRLTQRPRSNNFNRRPPSEQRTSDGSYGLVHWMGFSAGGVRRERAESAPRQTTAASSMPILR